jgi:Mce-associated membrane protein
MDRKDSGMPVGRDTHPGKEDAVSSDSAADATALIEEAEAEAAEAEAIAAAARARTHAMRLRRQALAEPDTEVDTDESTVGPAPVRRPWLRRLPWKPVVVTGAVICTLALLAASGYMTWHHRQVVRDQERSAAFAAAARQGVVSLMSLDFNKAKEDVQRIIDNSTGQFKQDFQSQADDFAKVAASSKVITYATVNATAVESMTEDTAVVLVAASSHVTNAAGAKQEPRTWRLSVNMARDGGQINIAKVEFVP